MKRSYKESRRRGKPYIQYEEGRRKTNWIGHTLRRHCLLKHIIEERYREG